MATTIYWANGVFTLADRDFNRKCADYLRDKYDYQVTLPQYETKPFADPVEEMNHLGLAQHCVKQVQEHDVVIVVLDGADTDSGASFEAGARHISGGTMIGLRTDFRPHESKFGNAMFHLLDETIYVPSNQCEDYTKVCDQIHLAIRRQHKPGHQKE